FGESAGDAREMWRGRTGEATVFRSGWPRLAARRGAYRCLAMYQTRGYLGAITEFVSPESRRRTATRLFCGPVGASGWLADSRPPSRTPKRVHKEAAARQPPATTETARDLVTDASALPTPPAMARYSDAFINLPGLPTLRCLTCSGSMLSSMT